MIRYYDLQPAHWVTVRGGGWFGRQEREKTKSPVGHVGIFTGPIGPGRADFIEAQPGGVRWGHLAEYDPATSYQSKRVLTARETSGILDESVHSLERGYGYIADIFLGTRAVHLWVPQAAFRIGAVVHHRECAQMVDANYLVGAGIHNFADGRLPGEVTPGALYYLDYPHGPKRS